MGELFRWEQPAEGLAWTGERFVNGINGDGRVEIEHLHRYFMAREYCRGKSVLDVASGEGYGSSLLAQVASRVVGIDSDAVSVEHADANYKALNLRFVQGSATELPVEPNSIDVVVSFETLEHFAAHEQFLAEVKRVLKADGSLLISTPDVSVYSAGRTEPNQYHVRELTESEFVAELSLCFSHVVLLRQRVIVGSAILPDSAPTNTEPMVFERRGPGTYEVSKHLLRAPYLLALASNCDVESLAGSVYVHSDELHGPPVDNSRDLELMKEALRAQMAAAHEEAVRREAELSGTVAELRQQLIEARNSYDLAREAGEAVRQEAQYVKEELKSISLARQQQELVLRRLQRDLVQRTRSGLELEKLETELGAARLELAQLTKTYNEVCKLIIPVWMRRSLPSSLKSPLRAVKRALRHG